VRVKPNIGNSDKIINNILSSNRWTNRVHKPRTEAVAAVLYEL